MWTSFLRTAARNLWRNKFFSAINILGFAVGIAGFVLILFYIRHDLSYDRFHPDTNRLYLLTETMNWGQDWRVTWMTSAPMGPALVEEYPEVEATARLTPWLRQTLQKGDRKFVERIWFGDPNMFTLFGFPLTRGEPGKVLTEPNTIALSSSAAKKFFGDADPIGKVLHWNDKTDLTVAGVFEDIPDNSTIQFDYLVSFCTLALPEMYGKGIELWAPHNFYTYLLLEKGADPDALRARFPGFIDEHFGPEGKEKYRPGLKRISELHLNGDYSQIRTLGMIAFFILLIAVVNFMNLSTARASRRAREIGVRKVLGGSRWNLIVQFLGEAFIITLIAAAVAMVLIEVSLPEFSSLSGKHLGWSLIADTQGVLLLVGVVLFAGLLAGSYPAFYLSAFPPVDVLKSGRMPGGKGAWVRRGLVTLQFGISIALIISTLTVRSQHNFLTQQDVGFDREHLLYLPLESESIAGHAEDFRDRIKADPDVISASVVSRLLGRVAGGIWTVKTPAMDAAVPIYTVFTDEDFVKTHGLKLAEGRGFSRDFPSDPKTAFLVNEKAAEKLGVKWDGDRRIELPGTKSGEVVGILKDFHFQSLYRETEPIVLTYIRGRFDRQYLAVRVRPGATDRVIAQLETIWADYDPALTFKVHFLDRVLERQYWQEKRLSSILSLFAGFAVFVALLGLFALSTFLTEQRTKEIGIRKTLGASVTGILTLLGRDFARPVIAANLIAWPVAWYFLRNWLNDFVYRVPLPVMLFAVVSVAVLLVAEGTVILQAWRAARANPVDALRHE